MRFNSGWVKIHRWDDDHWLNKSLIAQGLWTKLIMMANYKESKILRNGKFETLERGQILTTIAELRGNDCGRAVVERLLNLMVVDGMITQKTSNDGRIITICNYSKYQDLENDDQQRSNNGPTTVQQHNSNGPTHSKEGNNNKKVKKERINTLISVESSALTVVSSGIGHEWLEYALSEMPWMAGKPSWTAERFAQDLEKVKRATQLNDDGLRAILAFVRKDDFWRDKACSPTGLLKKNSAGLRKIDNIIPRLRTPEDRKREELRESLSQPFSEDEMWEYMK